MDYSKITELRVNTGLNGFTHSKKLHTSINLKYGLFARYTDVRILRETEKAIKIYCTEQEQDMFNYPNVNKLHSGIAWLPKSQITEITNEGIAIIPEWLEKKIKLQNIEKIKTYSY